MVVFAPLSDDTGCMILMTLKLSYELLGDADHPYWTILTFVKFKAEFRAAYKKSILM